jgi:CBS domain-containing protein
MTTVREFLAIKGSRAHTISDHSSVLEAVKKMNDLGIGCLVVTSEGDRVVGMTTERDVLQRLAAVNDDVSGVAVGEIMTKRVIACGLDDPIDTVQSIMKNPPRSPIAGGGRRRPIVWNRLAGRRQFISGRRGSHGDQVSSRLY